MKTAMMAFSAGALGALANSLVVWLFGLYGITQALGVSIAPLLTPAWLYPRIVWGGLWGFLFLLPWLGGKPLSRGVLLSLFPTAAQLFIFFPYHGHQGIAGLALGLLTPLMVFFFNAVWGVVTAVTLRVA